MLHLEPVLTRTQLGFADIRPPERLALASRASRNGAPSTPVTTPTGIRAGRACSATRSASSTSAAPTSPAGTTGEPVPRTRRWAIGPDRKATNAIGPVAEVATETSATATRIRANRVRSACTPSPVASSSPSCSTPSRWASSTAAGTSTTSGQARRGRPSQNALFSDPVSQRIASFTWYTCARVST